MVEEYLSDTVCNNEQATSVSSLVSVVVCRTHSWLSYLRAKRDPSARESSQAEQQVLTERCHLCVQEG